MVDVQEASHRSIGEVLGLLLEEFPDVTISKIRFLESQGLISPERTSSGYRKFFQDDVDLLRVILTEQRTNYLPLRVIKNRLATGEIDPTGEHLRPNGVDGDGTDGDHSAEADAASAPTRPPSRFRREFGRRSIRRGSGREHPLASRVTSSTTGHRSTCPTADSELGADRDGRHSTAAGRAARSR